MSVRDEVFERDEYRCQMPVCLAEQRGFSRAIDMSQPESSLWAPTLDHIRPRSRGGPSHKGNLRAAHRSCNQYAALPLQQQKLHVRRGPQGGILRDGQLDPRWPFPVFKETASAFALAA
jgi:5-methylcytosine-specific restriction endonuclease McrA